jgi:uncharacterized protein YjbI with pentapeptide repeats
MAILWSRWLRRIAIAIIVIVVVLALQWAVWWLWSLWSPQWDGRTIIATAVAGLVPLAAIWWLWWRLPRRQVARLALKIRDPKARADTEDNFRRTVGQALGGAAVLIGAGAAYLQFSQQQQTATQQIIAQQKIASDQIAAQQQTAEVSRKASQDLLISNQVSKSFEQLGSAKSAVRVGGVYALEGVMDSSPQYRQPVLEALCAFVRDQTIGTTISTEPTIDIQAALTVIGRRPNGSGRIDLSGANIPNANLFGAQLLQSAILRGANLSRALLRQSYLHGADLMKANLSQADLRRADLTGANLERADLHDANLTIANLSGAYLNEANLSGAILSGAALNGAGLNGAKLTKATLRGADLSDTNLTGADLTDAELTDAKALTQEQLNLACGKPLLLPPGLVLNKSCPEPRPVTPRSTQGRRRNRR